MLQKRSPSETVQSWWVCSSHCLDNPRLHQQHSHQCPSAWCPNLLSLVQCSNNSSWPCKWIQKPWRTCSIQVFGAVEIWQWSIKCYAHTNVFLCFRKNLPRPSPWSRARPWQMQKEMCSEDCVSLAGLMFALFVQSHFARTVMSYTSSVTGTTEQRWLINLIHTLNNL